MAGAEHRSDLGWQPREGWWPGMVAHGHTGLRCFSDCTFEKHNVTNWYSSESTPLHVESKLKFQISSCNFDCASRDSLLWAPGNCITSVDQLVHRHIRVDNYFAQNFQCAAVAALCSLLVLYNELDSRWLQVKAAPAQESPRCWSKAALQKTWQCQGTYQEKSHHDCPECLTQLGSPKILGPQPVWCFYSVGTKLLAIPSPGVYTSCLLPAASPRFLASCTAAGPARGLQSSLSYTHQANTFMKHRSFTR